ncbi:MAG TPA: type II toxin-antitoxin system RelE/ParE family toxin [Bryobacteraceae bacterium]
MKYQVIVTLEAQAGIRECFEYIHERSPPNAARGFRRFTEKLTPWKGSRSCAFARGREYLDDELRQLVFKSHRIVFAVEKKEKRVYVVSVRHARPAGGWRTSGG